VPVQSKAVARGWESKSVESQQSDRERERTPAAPVSDDAAVRTARRATLALARARAAADLERATHPSHRKMLEAAIRDLDDQIARV